ncbi:MAG TPA: response regulator transcription factor [Longimicrobium sp.]|nr:response regulator transcription factor [Longimicrobium sp.]
MRRILIVEDNADLAFGLRTTLEIEGFAVEVADDGPAGLERARRGAPDLVILDLMLPGMDGYRVLRELRGGGSAVPVLVLTARGEEYDKVLGFRAGADDYVTKPFSLLELIARVEALLRRAGVPAPGGGDVARFGEVEVHRGARTVVRGGGAVSVTPKEFDLLLALYDRDGGVATRHELLREVWGHRAAVLTRTVDIHVAELRRKLEPDPAHPRHILTVWKKGYRLQR